jgi:gamma-glutamylcyclotransferase (GGCT)/AIG2-like uncharacterized protein YtfP
MNAVFTYGSLMFADVWSRVVRGEYLQACAILPGYRLRAIREETFPAIIKTGNNDQVSGILYLDIDNSDLARLDEFEGDYYRRETVSVISAGKTIRAETFSLRAEFIHLLDERGWDAAEFERRDLKNFIANL